MRVRPAEAGDIPIWSDMRHALWPDADLTELADELLGILADPNCWSLMLVDAADTVQGFAEAQLRDMFEGTRVDPYPHMEALWIAPDIRRTGAARLLCDAVIARAKAEGYAMIGSDADLDNEASHLWHAACGFREESRQVIYRMPL